jgi:hypothetical protein
MPWQFGLMGASGSSILPAFVVRFDNSRTYSGLGGAFVDADGYSYISASNSNGGSDGGQIAQKVAPDNSVVWSYTYPNSYGGEMGLHADSSGNVYTGGFHGNAPGDYYLLVTKYTPSGNRDWQRWYGGSVTYPDWYALNRNGQGSMSGGAFTSGRFVSLDASGNTVFTRSGNLGAESGEGGYTAGMGPSCVFFGHRRRFNFFTTTGTFMFGRTASNFVGSGSIRGMGDSAGNVYTWVAADNANTMYITKFDSAGNQLWDRQLTTPAGIVWTSGQGDTDNDNNIYIPIGYRPGDSTTEKIVWVSLTSSGSLRYQRAVDVASVRDSATSININTSTKRGFVSAYANGNKGAFVSFDILTGNAVPKTAVAGGLTFSMAASDLTISTPSTLSYSSIGDIGGSTSVSTPSRGSSGGNTQYTITRGTFN